MIVEGGGNPIRILFCARNTTVILHNGSQILAFRVFLQNILTKLYYNTCFLLFQVNIIRSNHPSSVVCDVNVSRVTK